MPWPTQTICAATARSRSSVTDVSFFDLSRMNIRNAASISPTLGTTSERRVVCAMTAVCAACHQSHRPCPRLSLTDLPVGQSAIVPTRDFRPKRHGTPCAQKRISPAISTRFGSSRLPAENNPLHLFSKAVSSFASSRLMKRGVRVVTIRGVRAAVDATALRAREIAGRQ